MTKEFCDNCKKEIIIENKDYVGINFFGSISTKGFLSKRVAFCEKCYLKLDRKISEFLGNKIGLKQELVK